MRPNASPTSSTPQRAQKPSGSALRLFSLIIEARQRDGVARGEERRLAADRADLALDVVERQVAFGGGVELEDLGQAETLGEIAPYVGGKPVAAGEAQAMRFSSVDGGAATR